MSSSWIRVALNPVTRVLRKDIKGDTDTEKPHEDRSIDGKDTASPGTPGSPEAEKGRKDPPPDPLEGVGVWPCSTWISAAMPHLDL